MRKFKLIREYPGSPKLGAVVNYVKSENCYRYNMHWWFLKCLVEDSPEFWEEVIEKPVLFTTEDGVDIYEGDGIFIVNKFFNIGFSKGVEYNNHKDNKFFSTKEAAQEFIILNKPCLSINDIWNISNNKSSDNNFVIVSKKELKNLVKSKL